MRSPSARFAGARFVGATSLLLLALATAFYAVPFPWPANRFDDGISVVAAQRILRGDVPYVDFQTLYTPGGYYLVAAAFRAFGTTYDVASRLDGVLMAVQAWLAWHVSTRVSGSRFVGLLGFAAGLAFSHPFPSISLGLVAVMVAARAARQESAALGVAAGAVAGLAAWFRQDFGFAAAVAVAAALWSGTRGTTAVRLGRAAAAGAASAVVLALLLSPAIVSAPSRLFDGLVMNPAATVPFRAWPGGAFAVFREKWIFGSVALLAFVGGTLGLARVFAKPNPSNATLVGVAALTLWALRYLCLRPETHHLVPAGILVGVFGVAALPRACVPRLAAFAVCAAAVLVPTSRAAGARVLHALGRRDRGMATLGATLPGSETLWLPAAEIESYRGLVERVRAIVPPGEPFLSACDRHDRIHDQDLLLYFVADRPAVPFDWHFDPGVTTREDVQRGIVDDCRRAGVRLVVRFHSWSSGTPTVGPPGAHVLDDWIAAEFAKSDTFGRYEVWTRR